jgi:hypothetical protein
MRFITRLKNQQRIGLIGPRDQIIDLAECTILERGQSALFGEYASLY